MKVRFITTYDKTDVEIENIISDFNKRKKIVDVVRFNDVTIMIKYEDLIAEDRSRQGLFIPNEVFQGRFIVIDDGEVLNYGKSGKYEW